MADRKIVTATPALWQTIKDAADNYSRNKRLGEGVNALRKALPSDLVRVRNDTGANRRAGEVMGIGDTILDTGQLTNEFLWFVGQAPTGDEKFGILRKALPEDSIGELQVSGVCKAWVDVQDADDARAKVVAGSYVLQSGSDGPYKILWSPGDTGEQECVVVLDNTGTAAGTVVAAQLIADLCPGDWCATVECVVGSCDETPTTVCNPWRLSGQAGDRIAIAKVKLCGPGYGDYGVENGCDPYLPCYYDGNEDPGCFEGALSDDGNYKWVIIQIEHKTTCVVTDVDRRGDCIVQGKAQLSTMYCAAEVCGSVVGYSCCDPGGSEGAYDDNNLCLDTDLTFAPLQDGPCCESRCCDGVALPDQVMATFVVEEGECSAMNGETVLLSRVAGNNNVERWTGTQTLGCGMRVTITFYCDYSEGAPTPTASDFHFDWEFAPDTPEGCVLVQYSGHGIGSTLATCEPLYVEFTDPPAFTLETGACGCCDNGPNENIGIIFTAV